MSGPTKRAQWGMLESMASCDAAIKDIGLEILEVNNALLGVERNGARKLTSDELEWVSEQRDRLTWLRNARSEIKDRRRRLNDQKDELFEASFKLAARQILDDATYARIITRAQEIEATNNERRKASVASGSAIGARASVGGMRQRRQP